MQTDNAERTARKQVQHSKSVWFDTGVTQNMKAEESNPQLQEAMMLFLETYLYVSLH